MPPQTPTSPLSPKSSMSTRSSRRRRSSLHSSRHVSFAHPSSSSSTPHLVYPPTQIRLPYTALGNSHENQPWWYNILGTFLIFVVVAVGLAAEYKLAKEDQMPYVCYLPGSGSGFVWPWGDGRGLERCEFVTFESEALEAEKWEERERAGSGSGEVKISHEKAETASRMLDTLARNAYPQSPVKPLQMED